jgi:hypothetical protein
MTTFAGKKSGRRAVLSVVGAIAVLGAGASAAQQSSKQLQGHWQLVLIETERDGKRSVSTSYGENPKGLFIFDASGRYSIQIFRPGLPPFASKDRLAGTPEENKAVVQGMLAHFGTYKVNDADSTFTVLPEGSSFPNWTGVQQPARKFTIAGDSLTIVNPAPTTAGATSYLMLKRLH